jgi:uncharacterized protein YkwD
MRSRTAAAAAAAAALAATLCACGAGAPREGAAGDETARDADDDKPASAAGAALEASPASAEEAAAAEALFHLVNAARAEGGLKPLGFSDELAAVSRGYCVEMARTGAIAHESKISGGPADRAKRAGIQFTRLTENLALAADAAAAHEGLMNSPGHRANILDPAVSEVGIGAIAAIEDGIESLIVTQMFASPPERIVPAAAVAELTSRLNAARKAKSLKPFSRHPWLDARAAEALASCGASTLTYASKEEKAPPFHLLKAVMVEGGTLEQIAESFLSAEQSSSPHLTNIGVAVARVDGAGGEAAGACAVVFFAAKK